MKIDFGSCFFEKRKGNTQLVRLDSEKLINSHALIIGSSGVGKSFLLRKMIAQGQVDKRIKFHVFDVHGDLEIPGASTVTFSEIAPFGLNPFIVNPDPEFGGVRKCAQAFIRVLDQASSTKLGLKQEAVLRNLIFDVFRDFGFFHDDPKTWALNEADAWVVGGGSSNRIYLEVDIKDKDKVKAYGARWDQEHKAWWTHTENYKGELLNWKPLFKARRYPVLKDVLNYAKRIHLERFLGSDQRAIRALGNVNKFAKVFQKRLLEAAKYSRMHEMATTSDDSLEKAKEQAIEAYSNYVQNVQTGLELETLLAYDSADVLKSVIDRLTNLEAIGIFKSEIPPFDPNAQVYRYKLNALSQEEKKMLVLFLLQDRFNKAVEQGQKSYVTDVVVLDELSVYTSAQDDGGEGIIGVIAREARKFGLAAWCANQTPTGVPESLITSVGVKILLGLDERYWPTAVAKLRVEDKLLQFIQPTQTMAVQLKEKGSLKNRWWWTQIN